MPIDCFFFLHINRPCVQIRFGDTEGLFYFPEIVTGYRKGTANSSGKVLFPLWLLVRFWKNNQHLCRTRISYHWCFENKSFAIPDRNDFAWMCLYPQMKSCPITYAGGQLRCFSANVRINWRWTAIKSVLHRESEDTGWLCHLHTICVLLELAKSVLLKQGIARSVT